MKIKVQVKAGSRREESLEIKDDGTHIVTLRARAIDGQANRALVKFLAQELALKESQITITSGLSSRIKYLEIEKPA